MLAWTRIVMMNLAVLVLLLALVEGASSLAFLLRSMVSSIRLATLATSYTTYDPELGWVNVPDVSVADKYGPGKHLRTNARGFRNAHDIDEDRSGKPRVICSGDSFTFGVGVGNDQTWCARLASIAPCLETANLGQGGYGIDQAYLRYKRDGADLDHDLHLFAFITSDFTRMRSKTMGSYEKPLLEIVDGKLTVTNVPVPSPPFYARWLGALVDDIRDLRTFRLLASARRRLLGVDIAEGRARDDVTPENAGDLLKAILQETKRLTDARGSQLVLVFLPRRGQHPPDEELRAWSRFLQREAAALGVPLVDIAEEHGRMSPSEAAALFSDEHKHLSVTGNEYVARIVHRALRRLPQTAELALSSECLPAA